MEMGFDDSLPVEPGETAGRLRPLGWRELCARLAAAQDLRREGLSGPGAAGLPTVDGLATEGSREGREGSFHHPAALLLLGGLAQPVSTSDGRKYQERVNPPSSVNGKYAGGTYGTTQRLAVSAPRPDQSRRELP